MAAAAIVALSLAGVIEDLGYAGLALLMVVETVFPPVPSEAVLPLAGYFVGQGELGFVAVLITATAGSVLGAQLLYEAARYGGRPFVERFIRFARIDPERLVEAERWFARRGRIVVLLGRCVPGVRSAVSLPAGLLRMPRWEYAVFTALGSLAWNTLLIGAGYALGSEWERVADVIGPVSKPLLVLAVVGAGAALTVRGLRRRRRVRV